MAYGTARTEHNGAKRGKGMWDTKKNAKLYARKTRRRNDKLAAKEY